MSAATALSRADYLALGARLDGEYWDWLHSPEAPEAITEAEAIEWRDALLAAAGERHAAQPTWQPQDTHAERVAIASGRDPRRTLALHLRVHAEQAAKDARAHAKRLKQPPCDACGR